MMENGYDTKENAFSSIDTLNSFKNDRKKDDESAKSDSKKSESTLKEKHLTGFFNSFKTLSMPKKAVSEKDKNEPSRFFGEGVTFKAKLIGILEVEEARGDRMCQEALFELKMAVRAAGEHKQRINIVIAIDGIRLRDEKTGDCLHHHPVHKISFIAQDVADSRAFGYIFGSPDTSHRFFGIKTDKAASQVVMAMRDLFQAVYELKKREVEMAKQNIEQHQLKYGSSLFLDSASASSSKSNSIDQMARLKQVPREDTNKNVKNKTQTTSVIADLMDLELELNSLQQGLSQMERLTPSDPFGPSPSLPKEDPFGDSFTPPPCITTPPPAKLPPPPASGDRRKVGGSTSSAASQPELHWFDRETQDLFSSDKNLNATKEDKEERGPLESKSMSSSRDLYDIFVELDPLGTGRSKPYTDKKDFFQELKNPPKKQLKDLKGRVSENDGTACYGTTSTRVLFSKDEGERMQDEYRYKKWSMDTDGVERIRLTEESSRREEASNDPFETGFANFASFDNGSRRSPASYGAVPRRSPQPHLRQQSPPVQLENHASPYGLSTSTLRSSSNSSKSVYKSITSGDDVDSPSSQTNEGYPFRRSPQWGRQQEDTSRQKIVIDLRKVLSNVDDTDKENDSPVAEEAIILRNPDVLSPAGGGNVSSDSFESIPEPPPRPITSPIISQPPPLPPKKLQLPVTLKPPPPRPSSERTSHYDYIENYESVGSARQTLRNGDVQIPPLPAPARKPKFSQYDYDHRDFVRHRPHKQHSASSVVSASDSDYYLTPISKSRLEERGAVKHSKPSLNITISQLTSSGFEDLAAILRIPASALSKMTLKELTECLSRLTEAECQKLERDMNNRNRRSMENSVPKYRSLRESFDEDTASAAPSFVANFEEKFLFKSNNSSSGPASAPPQVDKYAVFRELIDQEQMSSSFNAPLSEPPDDNDDEVPAKTEDGAAQDKENETPVKEEEENDRYAVLKTTDPSKEKDEDGDLRESESDAAVDESKDLSKTPIPGDGNGLLSNNSSPMARPSTENDAPLKSNAKAVIGESTAEFVSKVESQPASEPDTQGLVENKTNNTKINESQAENEVGKNWAKFDSEQETKEECDCHVERSLWREEPKDGGRKVHPIKYKKQMSTRRWREYDIEDDDEEFDFEEEEDDDDEEIARGDEENEFVDDGKDEDYGDDSEENWESSKRSLASSWDESSWRENGWSDRDSLYDEGELSPTSSYFEQQSHLKRRGYHRKYATHSRRPPSTPMWKDDVSVWIEPPARRRDVPPYREYLDSAERGYDTRRVRTPDRKQRYDPNEENELALLRKVLGKKRLKALEEQLFKRYHEQLSEKSGPQSTAKRHPGKMKGSACSLLFDRPHDDARGRSGRRSAGAGKKYYHTQARPRSADKGCKPLLSRPEDTVELYVSNAKGCYRRPYSQDELSVSEEERWASRLSPSGAAAGPPFKKLPSSTAPSARSRQHSQNSPFEDNFAPSGRAYSELGSDSAAAADESKLASTSTTTITTAASSLSTASLLRSRNQQLPQSRYSTTHTASNAYASCDNLKYGRSSRDSSQRQSPFDDDFAASDAPRTDGGEECADRRRPDDDVFFGNGVAPPTVTASGGGTSLAGESGPTGARKGRPGRTSVRGSTEPGQRTSSETSHASASSKYYENVELRKKKSPSDSYGGTLRERHRKEVATAAELAAASPKKGKRGGAETARRHDPFNDNVVHGYESRTVPRLGQKARSMGRNTTYEDSGSDSTEPDGDASAFAFSDPHNRK